MEQHPYLKDGVESFNLYVDPEETDKPAFLACGTYAEYNSENYVTLKKKVEGDEIKTSELPHVSRDFITNPMIGSRKKE